MELRELVGLGTAFVFLAGVSVAIIYGDRTAQVLGAGATGFGNMIRAATLRG